MGIADQLTTLLWKILLNNCKNFMNEQWLVI